MAKQTINIGTVANDGTGDDLRVAMQKVNDNFTELYAGTLAATTLEFSDNNITATGTNDSINFVPNGTGTINFPAIRIDDNNIVGLRSSEDLNIIPSGSGGVNVAGLKINNNGKISSIDSTTVSIEEGLTVDGTVTATAFVGNLTGNVTGNADTATSMANVITIVGDDSTGTTLNSQETFKIAGGTSITTAVSGDTLTITGPDVSSYITDANLIIVGDDSTGVTFSAKNSDTVKIAGGTNITTSVSGDTVTINGSQDINVNSITSTDSSLITINDNVQINGNIQSTTTTKTISKVGSSGSPATTNQDIDLTSYEGAEIYVNGDITINFTGVTTRTEKSILIILTTGTIRSITYQINGVTQNTVSIGDGSTLNTKQQFTIHSFIDNKIMVRNTVI